MNEEDMRRRAETRVAHAAGLLRGALASAQGLTLIGGVRGVALPLVLVNEVLADLERWEVVQVPVGDESGTSDA